MACYLHTSSRRVGRFASLARRFCWVTSRARALSWGRRWCSTCTSDARGASSSNEKNFSRAQSSSFASGCGRTRGGAATGGRWRCDPTKSCGSCAGGKGCCATACRSSRGERSRTARVGYGRGGCPRGRCAATGRSSGTRVTPSCANGGGTSRRGLSSSCTRGPAWSWSPASVWGATPRRGTRTFASSDCRVRSTTR